MRTVVVQSPSHVRLFEAPWTAAHQASLSLTISWEFAQVHVHCISDAIQPSHPLMPSSSLALNLFHENTGLTFPLGRCGNKASKRLNNLLKVIELTITGYLYTKPGVFPPFCPRLLLRLNPMP